MALKNRVVGVLALVSCGMALGACSSSTSAAAIRRNPTPELRTLHERSDDIRNRYALMRNENWRMFWEDWSRVMYTDRASRLTPEPMTR
jgi:hypothetical protein